MNPTANASKPMHAEQGRPWWRYPIVWLVVGGPLTVVVASLFTVGIAVRHVDPVLDTSAKGKVASQESPALQARNHAAEQAQQPADR
ncbi:MAG: hypothetical protein RI907_2297 [Pseudomonadota bacterium]|jgi:hypothetical protein